MTPEKGGEFRGKSVEAAISSGLASLGLSRNEVEVEIVRPGSRGLLGIGAEDAVVRLTPLPAAPKRTTKVEPTPAVKAEPATTTPRQEPKPAPQPEVKAGARAQTAAQTEAERAPQPAVAEPKRTVEAADAIERGREFLAGMLQRMNVQATVEIVPQSEAESSAGERVMVLNIVGEDLGMLIGRQNEVLSSLQFITRLMVNQQTRVRSNLVVDVNGYKAKRAESLRKLALRTAEQVEQTGRVMSLEPMAPAERRIIHLTLRNHPNVITQSVGEGSRRKVTVLPKKS